MSVYEPRTESREAGAAAAGESYRLLTPERVSLQYDLAGIGSRAAAALVDVLLQVLALALTGVMFLAANLAGDLFTVLRQLGVPADLVGSVALAVTLVVLFLVFFGYHIVFEIVWNGQTPGKRLLGLRVIRESGYPLRAGDAVVRNLLRLVDSLPAAYVLGITVMLLNDRAKRLGDFAAGTIVVREGARKALAALAPPAPPPAKVERAAGMPALRAPDATLVRDFLARRAGLDAASRTALAHRLAATLAARYGLTAAHAERGDEPFLAWLVGGAPPVSSRQSSPPGPLEQFGLSGHPALAGERRSPPAEQAPLGEPGSLTERGSPVQSDPQSRRDPSHFSGPPGPAA